MATLPELLRERDVVLMDGGMGSSVEDRGVPVRNALWGSHALLTDEGRAINDALHEEFVAAGAEIAIANLHNASLEACRAFAGEDDAEALLARISRLGIESARRAGPRLVAAGLGSPEGPYATESRWTSEENRARTEPQVRAFREAGVDLVLFETLTTAPEIRAAAALAADLDLAFGGGLTCGEDGRTLAGVPMAEAAAILGDASPQALFIQCTRYDLVLRALETLLPVLPEGCAPGVYANDGRAWIDMRWHGDRVTPEAYAAEALRWRDAGARIIGGCCGTGPEHVAALAAALS
jgi:homocysteine S-methyltransferase